MNKKLISIVLPAYKEEKNISIIYEELLKVLEKIKNNFDYEIIFINDWSTDNSWEEIQNICWKDELVKWIDLSRNFWHQAALTAWLENAKWDVIISMDCDMQDPPTLLLDMLKEWDKWFEVVYARRKNRNDRFLKKYTAIWYYKIHNKISDTDIPRNVWDFRLIDKKVLKAFLRLPEKDRYIRWMFAWMWFKTTFVDFDRPERIHWETGYTWKKMFKLAMDWILNFSMFPLKIGFILWIIMICMSIFFTGYIAYDYFIRWVNYDLFKWITATMFWFMWLQFIFLWIMWEYIWRIYNEAKDRPIYIIRDTKNLEKNI